MSESTKHTIEIKGVKLEVDLREATTIHTYKVGDPVKVLTKKYGSTFTSCPGVIIAFDMFEQRPSLGVMYVEDAYTSSPELKLVTVTKDTEDTEICPASPEEIRLSRDAVALNLQKRIDSLSLELQQAVARRDHFMARLAQM
jgi:hypothetical protein